MCECNQYKVLGIVPARGGSKGIPRKNLKLIAGQTLVHRAVKIAIQCPLINEIILSTDDEEIAREGAAAGANIPFLRPQELAADNVKTIDVVIHLLANIEMKPDIVVLLQPTAPVRTAAQLKEVLEILFSDKNFNAVVSVVRLHEPHPMKVKAIRKGKLTPYISDGDSERPRQELPAAYKLNGAFYAVRTEALLRERTFLPANTVPYIMPEEAGINIDTSIDLMLLECCLERGVIRLD